MRIAVLGAGAIGGLVAAHLVTSGYEVLVHSRGEHGARMAVEGLNISGEMSFSIAAQDWLVTLDEVGISPELENSCEMAIITSKAMDTEKLAIIAGSLCQGPVLSLQNGLGNLEIVSEILGPQRAFAATTTHGVTKVAPGQLNWAGRGQIEIESQSPFFTVFDKAGLNPSMCEDVSQLLWNKLLINVGINPLAALCGIKNGELLKDSLFQEACAVMLEAANVARIEGVSLEADGDLVETLREVIIRTSENECSMLQDVRNGRKTEIEMICGEVVRRGERAGFPCPRNTLLLAQIDSLN
jgi:2-dehydropantoate 2-reductase